MTNYGSLERFVDRCDHTTGSVYKRALNDLIEQLEAAQQQLHAEQRDRNWWAANNSRERQQLQEQLEALRHTLADIAKNSDDAAARNWANAALYATSSPAKRSEGT